MAPGKAKFIHWKDPLYIGKAIVSGSIEDLSGNTLIDPDTPRILAAANYTTAGGAAAEAITVTGAATTDIPFVTMQDDGTSNVTIVSAAITANTLTVTFSADPGSDTIISYQILRPTS